MQPHEQRSTASLEASGWTNGLRVNIGRQRLAQCIEFSGLLFLGLAPTNILASRVERAPENLVLYAKMVLIIWDQATRIRELEQNLECMWEAKDIRCCHDRHRQDHSERDHDEPHHHRPHYHSEEPSPGWDNRPWEKKCEHRQPPRSGHSCCHNDHAESCHSGGRNMDQHHFNRLEDSEDDNEMPFSNYIMSILLSKRFKSPTDLEPYKGSLDL